jgi:serine/threonine protein kinase/TolA-binding protein
MNESPLNFNKEYYSLEELVLLLNRSEQELRYCFQQYHIPAFEQKETLFYRREYLEDLPEKLQKLSSWERGLQGSPLDFREEDLTLDLDFEDKASGEEDSEGEDWGEFEEFGNEEESSKLVLNFCKPSQQKALEESPYASSELFETVLDEEEEAETVKEKVEEKEEIEGSYILEVSAVEEEIEEVIPMTKKRALRLEDEEIPMTKKLFIPDSERFAMGYSEDPDKVPSTNEFHLAPLQREEKTLENQIALNLEKDQNLWERPELPDSQVLLEYKDDFYLDLKGQSLEGQTLGVCRILKRIGEGGMGTIYLADHLRLQKKVALKILPPELSSNPKFIERFYQEARAAARLEHPNIVHVYDVRVSNIGPFIVMQYIEGTSLTTKILEKAFTFEEKLNVLHQVLLGTASAHEQGLVHRDLKTDNILISISGEVKIADFGLAQSQGVEVEGESQKSSAGYLVGTPDYLAPEICSGKPADVRSDIYALGVLFYYTLTEQLPFHATNIPSLLLKHIHEEPVPPRVVCSKITPSLNYIVLKMLQKVPEERYATLKDLLSDFEIVCEGRTLPRYQIKSIVRTSKVFTLHGKENSGSFSPLETAIKSFNQNQASMNPVSPQISLKKYLGIGGLLLALMFVLWIWNREATKSSSTLPHSNPVEAAHVQGLPPQKGIEAVLEDPWKKQEIDPLLKEGFYSEARKILVKKREQENRPLVLEKIEETIQSTYQKEIQQTLLKKQYPACLKLCEEAIEEFPQVESFRESRKQARFACLSLPLQEILRQGERQESQRPFLFEQVCTQGSREEKEIILEEYSEWKRQWQTQIFQKIQGYFNQKDYPEAYATSKSAFQILPLPEFSEWKEKSQKLGVDVLLEELKKALTEEAVSFSERRKGLEYYELSSVQQQRLKALLEERGRLFAQQEQTQEYQNWLGKIAKASAEEAYLRLQKIYETEIPYTSFTEKQQQELQEKKLDFQAFWKGKTLYTEKKWQEALNEYQAYSLNYPAGLFVKQVEAEIPLLQEFLDLWEKCHQKISFETASQLTHEFLEKHSQTLLGKALQKRLNSLKAETTPLVPTDPPVGVVPRDPQNLALQKLKIKVYAHPLYAGDTVAVYSFLEDQEQTKKKLLDPLSLKYKAEGGGSFQQNFYTLPSQGGSYRIEVFDQTRSLKAEETLNVLPVRSRAKPQSTLSLSVELSPLARSDSRYTLKLRASNETPYESTQVILQVWLYAVEVEKVLSSRPEDPVAFLAFLKTQEQKEGKTCDKLTFDELTFDSKSDYVYQLELKAQDPQEFFVLLDLSSFENRYWNEGFPPLLRVDSPLKPVAFALLPSGEQAGSTTGSTGSGSSSMTSVLPVKIPEAEELYTKAKKELNEAQTPFGRFRYEGHITSAKDLFKKIVENFPHSTHAEPAAYYLAEQYFKENPAMDGTLNMYNKCLEFNPNTEFNARLKIAEVYKARLDIERSKKAPSYAKIEEYRKLAIEWYEKTIRGSKNEQEIKDARKGLEALSLR